MNGPTVLNSVRQQLADEIFSHRELVPAPLNMSPWMAMSCLQKAIRRGEIEIAQRAAATLLLIAPDRLWRRTGAIAFEEVGVADLRTVSLVTAALAGKRFRATLGGEWKVASFVVNQMAKAPKCRAADDLLLIADSHPLYGRARADLATKATAELIRIASGNAALPVRALATWYAVGTHPRQTKHLSARPVDLMDALRKSIGGSAAVESKAPTKPAKKPRKAAAGQKEMLMSIQGKKPAKEAAAKKPAARSQRKSA
jgi:hypothetical protein